MLRHPTLDKLHALRLTGMGKALEEQFLMPDLEALSFEERLGLLVDREFTERDNRRLQTRLRKAKLRHSPPPSKMSITATPEAWIRL